MAWTNPKTWQTGEVLSSNDMNLYVGDNTQFLKDQIDVLGGDYSYTYAFSRPFDTTTTIDLDDALGDGTDTSWIRAVGYRIVAGGGGGGSGGTTNRVGGGGGAGGAEWGFIAVASWLRSGGSSSVTITIGAGGAGGSASGTGQGGTGGTTSIAFVGTTPTVGGGTPGVRSPISQLTDNRGTPGGNPGGNTNQAFTNNGLNWRVEVEGGWGRAGMSIIHADSSLRLGGDGGDSAFGGGGRGGPGRGFGDFSGVPTAGMGYGGGGGGAAADAVDGGAGHAGHAILHFYR